MATVWIPYTMQSLTTGNAVVSVQGENVRQLIQQLDYHYPGMKEALLKEGKLKPDIAVAVDGQISELGLLQPINEESDVYFIPAIAGG